MTHGQSPGKKPDGEADQPIQLATAEVILSLASSIALPEVNFILIVTSREGTTMAHDCGSEENAIEIMKDLLRLKGITQI